MNSIIDHCQKPLSFSISEECDRLKDRTVGRDRFAGKRFYSLVLLLLSAGVMLELAKWEYKVILIKTQIHSDHFQADSKPVIEDVQNDLNALGNEGWELVSIQDIHLPDGRMFTVAYLKRQKH
jgi:hypothetical protein